MSTPRSIAIATAGDERIGLGHVMRCASIAREAQRQGIAVVLWVRGSARATSRARQEAPGVTVRHWTHDTEPAAAADALILDTPGDLAALLAAARARAAGCVVLDRSDCTDEPASRWSWTVLPVLHARAAAGEGSAREERVRTGADWCIVEPRIRGIAAPPYPGQRDRLLLSFGGADPEGLTPRAVDALPDLSSLPFELEPLAVVGPAAPSAFARRLRDRCAVLHAPDRRALYDAMGRARLAVCSFGLTLYELAALGTPALVFTRGPEDARAAHRLEALGIGRRIGDVASFDPSVFATAIVDALRSDWPAEDSRRGAAAVGDGLGPRRILELALGPAEGSA